METYQPKGVKPESRERKLRSDTNLKRAPKKKGVQHGFGVYVYVEMITG